MGSQRLNRINKKYCQDRARIRYNGTGADKPITDTQTGFIHHPRGFPLEYKRVWFEGKTNPPSQAQSDMGLIFQSDNYLKPGTIVEITIPLRNALEKFRGKVVMVRNKGDYFEIGLWLKHREDASRARIVEQICHIEAYLKEKKFRDGPYVLNQERAAAEWISKNASSVPGL